MSINWIDVFCASLLLVFFFLGIWSGLVKSLVRIAAWIGGAAGVYYSPQILGPFLQSNFDLSETVLAVTTRVLGFLVPFLVLQIIGFLLNRAIKKSPLSVANRLGGGFLGLVKAAIPCLLLLSALHFLPISGTLLETRNNAVSYSIYTSLLDKTGLDEKRKSLQESLSKTITDKVIDKASEQAKESVKKP